MGSQSIQFLIQFPVPISQNYHRLFVYDDCAASKAREWRRRRRFSGCRGGGSRWEWEKSHQRSRFSDAYATDDYDEEVEFGFRNAAKQRRTWWADDFYAEDDDEDEGFGILEVSIGFNWVFKVFQAFGWMVPAVIISLVLGTGPNSIIMALALPLVQSALSLAVETIWGRSNEAPPRPKSKSKRRPSARGTRARQEKENENRTQTGKDVGNYKSWVDANNNVSAKTKKKSPQNFGGWDELDNHMRSDMGTHSRPVKEGIGARVPERGKITRRTNGDTPLLVRLLIALFPYLGFWTKLF